MIPVLSVANMRRSDAAAIAGGIPGRELMARAGRGIFESTDWKPPVGIFCGSGNNAGDGYVLALHLKEAGIPCTVFLTGDRFSPDGRFYYERCRDAGVRIREWTAGEDLSSWGTLVDCLFGTGFRGEIRGTAREVIEAMNASPAYKVAVDINSGLDGDSGMGELCVQSDLTVSVGGFQPGHFLNRAKDVMKRKINLDIGISPAERTFRLMEDSDFRGIFPPRRNLSHKGTYGYIGLIGGSEKYQGAIRLAAMANAAMRSGAGVVKAAVPRSLCGTLAPLILESTMFPLSEENGELQFREREAVQLTANLKAAAFGMGIGESGGAAEMLHFLLTRFPGKLAVDADGLNLLAKEDRTLICRAMPSLVLTPHIGEFSRLTGKSAEEILSAPIDTAENFARDTGSVVLLKGPTTVITDGQDTRLVDAGCPGMATAGSGDVLSGILAALLAWMKNPLEAAAAAAWINGRAGESAQRRSNPVSMIASDTVAAIPEIISRMIQE